MRTLDVYATSDIARSSFVFIDAFIEGPSLHLSPETRRTDRMAFFTKARPLRFASSWRSISQLDRGRSAGLLADLPSISKLRETPVNKTLCDSQCGGVHTVQHRHVTQSVARQQHAQPDNQR